ncbi:MAG TPA: GNAT family N-acetyltransferase [Ideonella sp.]|nr:GNAT family N-acetyltransferase [Ideonella sp.]
MTPPPPAAAEPAIRPATPDDLPALALLFDAYRQFYRQPADLALAARFLRERLARGESLVLLAHPAAEPGTLLGFCQLYPSFCSVAAQPIQVLYDLFVSPAARRSGAGRALLRAAHAQAAAAGVHRLDLTTARDNRAAQALYESLGWVRDEVFLSYSLAVAG